MTLSSCRLVQIYNYMAIRKADFAARSGHNMEYLAFLAAVFFPLTLFTV